MQRVCIHICFLFQMGFPLIKSHIGMVNYCDLGALCVIISNLKNGYINKLTIYSLMIIPLHYQIRKCTNSLQSDMWDQSDKDLNKPGWAEPHFRFHQFSAHNGDHLYDWGCLPLEVVFILRICKIWFGPLSLSLKFEYDPISGCWDIPL